MPVFIKIMRCFHVIILPKIVARPELVYSIILCFACEPVYEIFVLRYQVKHADGNSSSPQADTATATSLYLDETLHFTVREALRFETESNNVWGIQ